jgi:TP901-1 family phage major tail protein
VRQVFFDGAIRNWQVVLPDFGTITGAFQITSLDYRGEHSGEVTFEIAMESAGALAFAAL